MKKIILFKTLLIAALISTFFSLIIQTKGIVICLQSLLMISGVFSLYGALQIIIQNSIKALFSGLSIIILSALLPDYLQIFTSSAVFIGSLIFCLIHKKQLIILAKDNWRELKKISLIDIITWFLLFCSIIFLLVNTKSGYSAYDSIHPIYELSIGHSFKKQLLNAPDLSYLGRPIRYHFFSTQLPLFFSTIFNTNLLEGAYFFTPLFLLIILFLLLQIFFIIYPIFQVPILFLFFIPFWNFDKYYSCLFSHTIWFSHSFFLGGILLIFTLIFFIEEQWQWMLASMGFLLLSKASFFITATGGIFLYLFRQKRIRELLSISTCLGTLFICCYFSFLSGAHAHNLWILFPHFLRACFFNPENLHIFTFLLLAISFLILLQCYIANKYNKHMLALYSICLSGLLGCFLISEVCENNVTQFYNAIYFPAALLIWTLGINSLKKLYQEKFLLWTTLSHIAISIIFITSCGATIPSFFTHMRRTYTGYKLLKSINPNIYRKEAGYRAPGGTWDTNTITIYQWLNLNAPKNSIILFSPHYEVEGDWWAPRTGFIRSAMSARQMILEENWSKSILMEPDYPKRYADILNFYQWAIKPSEPSQKRIAMLKARFSESPPGISLDQDNTKLWRRLMYTLSLGKKWYGHNRLEQVAYEIGRLLTNEYNEKDALNFLDSYPITHIILENGDQSGDFLKSITQEIYRNNTIIILEKIA